MGGGLRLISFSSGSCGNCALLLGPSGKGILIDAGVGMRRIKKELDGLGLGLQAVSAILITHDHGDHIRSLGSWCKRLAAPVWTSATLLRALQYHPFTREWIGPCGKELAPETWNPVTEDFQVRFFVVPHDATECLGFAIRCGEQLLVWMTDLGEMTPEGLLWAREASTVVVESNYDMDMLLGGNYPIELKRRITHGIGHLSNDACAQAIRDFWHPGLRNIFLCHLSGNNNTPELAWNCAQETLQEIGVPQGGVSLRVLRRGVSSPLVNL